MAASAIEICNMMLTWLSTKQIVTFEDSNSKESEFCNANYDPSRRSVLEIREWSFATKRIELNALADSPVFGYDYKFLLPDKSLRILGVYNPLDSGSSNPATETHKIENDDGAQVILANIDTIHVKYIFDQTNPVLFSPAFDQALAAYMAYNGAVPLTQDKDQQVRMFGVYKDMLEEATFADSLQGSRELLETSQLEKSRRMFVTPS